MLNKLKVFKLLLLTASNVALLGSSVNLLVSCSKKNIIDSQKMDAIINHEDIPIWYDYYYIAASESPLNVVSNNNIKGWNNLVDDDLKNGDFDWVTNVSITRTVINLVIHQSATFTIIYKHQKYNSNDWKYNKDASNTFVQDKSFIERGDLWSTDASVPLDNVIKVMQLGNVVYAATDSGLYLSKNNQPFIQSKSVFNLDVKLKNKDSWIDNIIKINKVIYLVTNNGLYVSHNNGDNFVKNISIPNVCNINNIVKINNITYIETKYSGLFYANDGITFKADPSIKANSWIDSIVEVDNVIYVATRQGLYTKVQSATRGAFVFNETLGKIQINQVSVINNSVHLATSKGIYVLGNDAIFTLKSEIANVYTIVKFNDDSTIYAGSDKGLYRSNDGQKFKLDPIVNSSYEVSKIVNIDQVIYVTTNCGLFNKSIDNNNFCRNNSVDADCFINQIIEINKTIYLATDNSLWTYNEI